MSRKTVTTRRRVSLLASSSLVAASLMAGVGGVAVLTPSQALAANECGDPSANAGADDVMVCNGAYTEIDYTTTTDGNLVVLLVDQVTVTTGGINVIGNAGEDLAVTQVTAIAGAGDVSVNNNAGRGVNVVANNGDASIELIDGDLADGSGSTITGSSGGLRAVVTAGAGDATVLISGGTVTGNGNFGIITQTPSGNATVEYGTTTVSGDSGVRAQSPGGLATVTGTGDVTATGAGNWGVWAGGGSAGAEVDIGGLVTSAGGGVHVQAVAGGTANVTVGDIDAVDTALEVTANNGGDANILGTGALSGASGIVAAANTGNVSVTTGGTVDATAGVGVSASAGFGGNVTIDTTAGQVTASADGVAVQIVDGDADITVGDVDGGFYGVVATATGSGGVTMTVNGAVSGDFSDAVDIDTNEGDIDFTLSAGASLDTTDPINFGADLDTQGGNIVAVIDGDILEGGLGVDVNAGAGTVNLTGAGAITSSDYSAVEVSTVDGDLTVNLTGALDGGVHGVAADVNGAGNASITTGAITADDNGIDLDTATGTSTVTTNGVVTAGLTGVRVAGGGDVEVNVNDDVFAGVTGVDASSSAGASTVNVAAGVTIDPEDYGIINVAATDSTVVTGDGVTILIDNSTDNDAIAVGVYAESTAAADTGAGDPSVEVSLGTNNSISLLPGGSTDGGAGIWAENSGGGTGSVAIETGDGTLIDTQGDNTVAVYAETSSGDIDITLGTGRAWVYSGDGADSAGNFTVSAGVFANSTAGNITIDSNANVQAASVGGIESLGIYASTGGAGTVDITTGAGSYTWGSSYGIGVNAGDGAVTIVTDGAVESDSLEAIFVNGGTGAISVTNNATVTSGGATAIELDGAGAITVVANADVQGSTGIDVDGGAGLIDIDVAAGVTVTATAGDGIAASSGAGAIDIDVAGTVTATGGVGVGAVSTSGFVTIDTLGDVTGATAGILGTSGGVVNVTTSGGTITSTAGPGIATSSTGASTTVNNSSAINATGGDAINATALNAVSVTNSGLIAGTATAGIRTESTGASAADIFILNTGVIGSSVDGTTSAGIAGVISNINSSGDIGITTNASVYGGSSGVAATNAGTGGIDLNIGDTGPVTISADAAGSNGILVFMTNAAGAGAVTIDVGDGSTILAGTSGILVNNQGSGETTITLGDNVTIDPEDYGSVQVGPGDQTFIAGDNLSVTIGNVDGDAIAYGISVTSSALADAAVGDPRVDIQIGESLSILIDDGAGGEADGAAAIYAGVVNAASASVVVGDGLDIDVTGDSSVGVYGVGSLGDVTIDLGGGSIDLVAGDGADGAGNFTGSYGVAGVAAGGNVSIEVDADVNVANSALAAAGILGSTAGFGTVEITSNGVIVSSDVGILAQSTEGDITVDQNGAVSGGNYGIYADANGAGSVTVNSNASVTSTAVDGIYAVTDTGATTVITTAGTTITAGDDAITALVNTGAEDVTVTNNAALVANQSSGGGYGIYAWNSGTGDTIVANTGAIDGAAVYGLVAGANTGEVDVDNSAAIGSSADPVTEDGIYAYVAGGAGSVSVTNLATGVIWAGDQGIYAFAGGSGSVGVSNAAAIGGSANDGIHAESATGGVTVVNAGAIGSLADQVQDSGIEAIVNGGASGILVQNLTGIWAAGSGIVADNNGTGQLVVLNSGALTTGALGIYTEVNGGSSEVTNSGVINALSDGIQSNATGAGAITVTNSAAITASADGIDTNAAAGATLITNSAAITSGDNGIEADASGTGAITIANNAGGVISAGSDGIRALSTGGAVTVTTNATVAGGSDGIQTGTTGTAVSTVNVNASVTSGGAGAAGVNAATTGTGLIDVNVANGVTLAATNGSAVRTTSNGGAVTVDLGTGGVGAPATTVRGLGAAADSWVLDLNNAAGGTTTVNIASNATVRSNDNTAAGYDDLAIRGVGGSVVINNAGRLQGRVNFSGLTGNVVLNNSSSTSWHTTGASVFSGGADVLNNTASGVIFTNAGGAATSWDFGAGADTFTNAGILVVGEPTLAASTLTITNLEAWNNSGSIFFGSSGTTASDGQINDRIDFGSGTFTGSGSSRLFMDVNLGAVTQTSCAALTAADCFDATGASTAGSTTIRVNDTSGAVFGAFNPTGIVVVDVTGAGATSATNFSLLAGQPFWRADANSADGVLDKGLFFYDLTLNGKQHLLVGLPDGEAFEFSTVGQAAQAAWYTTTGTWFDRQADLRSQLDNAEAGAGVWMKITGSSADRDLENSYELFGVTYSFDTSYDQQTISVIGGVDFVGAATADTQWVLGGMIGYVDSDVNFDASPTVASMEGAVYGLYGTYLNKNWFVDGVLAFNSLDLDYTAPTLSGDTFASDIDTWGLQVEGGYTFALGGTAFVEPLASLSYLSTDIGTISVPGADIEWDDQTSLRGSLGARLGATASQPTFDATFSVTGRIWNEFEGENDVTIFSGGPDLTLTDDFSGSFGEISGSVNLFSNKAAFSAFVNAGVKFKDDYQSTDATLGFRWRW
jgi:hypothetical protein